MGFHGYYFNIKSGYITNKYPHCYVGIKRIGVKWGLYNRVSKHDYKWGLYNRVSNHDHKWGLYNRVSNSLIGWGNYSGDDMTITTSDYSLTQSGNFIIENNWHKISGTPFSGQTKLYDANGRAMNGNDYVLDIYFKIVACKADKTLFWKRANTDEYDHRFCAALDNIMNDINGAAVMHNFFGGVLCLAVDSEQDSLLALPNFEIIDDLPQGTPLSELSDNNNFYWAPDFQYTSIEFQHNRRAFLNTHNGFNGNYSIGTPNDSMSAMLKGIGHTNDSITYTVSTGVQDIGVPFTDNDNSHKYLLPELRTGFIMIDCCGCYAGALSVDNLNNIPEIAALYMCLDCHKVEEDTNG